MPSKKLFADHYFKLLVWLDCKIATWLHLLRSSLNYAIVGFWHDDLVWSTLSNMFHLLLYIRLSIWTFKSYICLQVYSDWPSFGLLKNWFCVSFVLINWFVTLFVWYWPLIGRNFPQLVWYNQSAWFIPARGFFGGYNTGWWTIVDKIIN